MRRTALLALLLVVVAGLATVAFAEKQLQRTNAPFTSPTSGEEMYTAYCASCHGAQAKGDGPAAPALKQPVPDLTRLSANNAGKFPFAHVQESIRGEAMVASHGSREMPVWGPVFRQMSDRQSALVHQRVKNLVSHLEKLQSK
ncbi:MAG TPA: cytochrome c [Clostridia bacterium]|nr:cytochrome c [Clostridia bacterium]